MFPALAPALLDVLLLVRFQQHTEVDVQYRYTFGRDSNYDITVGAVNVFDEEPPTAFFTGYEEALHNPLMRQLYIRRGASF